MLVNGCAEAAFCSRHDDNPGAFVVPDGEYRHDVAGAGQVLELGLAQRCGHR